MKRTIRNLLGVLLLVLALVVTQIPAEPINAATTETDFELDGTTLVKYTGTDYSVSVPASVKIIGEEAFSGNQFVKNIRMSKGVEVISYGAFSNCPALKKVSIPGTVTTIETGAFANCKELTSIELGTELTTLGNGVFSGCSALKSVSIKKGNPKFVCENGVIYDKDKTTIYQYCPGRTASTYSIPKSVTNIKQYAFWGCNSLENIALNTEMQEIDAYAFSNCKSLKSILIPYSVNQIHLKAFEDCVSLEVVELPPSIHYIHDTAFDGCINLMLEADEATYTGDYAKAFNAREKTEQAEYEDILDMYEPEEDKEASGEDTEKVEIQGPSNAMEELLGSTIIVGNRAVVLIDNTRDVVKDGANYVGNLQNEKQELQSNVTDEKGMSIPKYTITDAGVIADQAFYKDKSLTTYEIPEGVSEIGEFAFARSGLTSIVIPEGVTTIGYGAFYHCDNLNQVQLPSTLKDINPEAFEKTGWMENWRKSGSSHFLTAGDGILLAYNGDDANVNIPDGVKWIAPQVFKNHKEIKQVSLPDSVKIIGEGAFEGCSNLTQVSGGMYVKDIEDRAFAGCPIESARIADTIETLGRRSYDFSETNMSEDERVVVFQGNIPTVTNEETAQRLSNPEYRDMALKDVKVAVINKGIRAEELKGTVLDSDVYGFKGIIVSIESDTDKTLTLQGTTLTQKELANFTVPEYIELYDRQYRLEGIEKLESLAVADSVGVVEAFKGITVHNQTKSLPVGTVKASLEQSEGNYILSLAESENAAKRISTAYSAVYNTAIPQNLYGLDISLTDYDSKVSVTKLGRQKVSVTLELPQALQAGQLYILTMDANGQLESVPYVKNTAENGNTITFSVNHFSDFGLYTIGGTEAVAEVKNGKVTITSYGQKDDSPNTGDFFHPKWFLAGGLLFAALAVFFYKKKPLKASK